MFRVTEQLIGCLPNTWAWLFI